MHLQCDVDKERLIKCNIWLGTAFHLFVRARCQVGSRFGAHSAMTIHGSLA
jgi:hypothetical protein